MRFIKRIFSALKVRRSASIALQVLSDVAHLDPHFANVSRSIGQLDFSFVDAVRRDRAATAWGELFASLNHPYSRIIFVPYLSRGGADLVAVNAARAAIQKYGEFSLLIVATDSSRMEARDWLPKDAQIRVLSDYGRDLTQNDRVELTSWLIQALQPRSILNVNSRACWEVMRAKGLALSTFCNLYAALFCRDYNSEGTAIGYADTCLLPTLPHLKGIYFDNKTFADEIAQQFAARPSLRERLRVVYQPVPATIQSAFSFAIRGTQFPVMWAGRLCKQKNVELLIEIAKHSPNIQYEVFGSWEADYSRNFIKASKSIENLVLHGRYASFEALPIEKFGAFLYTSLWDGLPNVLLEAAAAGLPIVAPLVGGIGELVNKKTGWLISDRGNPFAYIDALEEIRNDPAEAARRSSAMRDRIASSHSWEAYVQAMSIRPSFLS